jgi:hypothetical protein
MTAMAQRNQHTGSGIGDTRWLATLVDTFEAAERLGDVPCDNNALRAVKARLARPATACAIGASEPDVQH